MSPSPPAPLSRRSWALLLGLAAAAVLVRWVTRTPMVYNWDSVHYVLAQSRYAILDHQPHPPGSYYYILLARVIRFFTGDPHSSLLVLSAVSGAGFVVVLFLLGREVHGAAAGWLAAAIGASAPLFWFYGVVGLNYAPAGVLSATVALACVRLCGLGPSSRPDTGGDNSCTGPPPRLGTWRADALLAGTTLGLLGGVRPTDEVFLVPAFLWSLAAAWRRSGKALPVAFGLVAAAVLTLAWLVPNCVNTGGLEPYLASIQAQEHLFTRSSVFLARWPALQDALVTHRRCLESTLGIAWLPLLAALALRLRSRRGRAGNTLSFPRSRLVADAGLGTLIVAPPFLFYLLGHFNSPGYTLVYAGYLAALAAGAVARSSGNPPRLLVPLGAAILAGNTALTLWGWPGAARLGQRSLSIAEIRDHARYYNELRGFLTASYPPRGVRLLASWNSTDGLRVVQAALPAYAPDVAQAVLVAPALPASIARLPFLKLMTPRELAVEGRPVFAIVRTKEDPGYHAGIFGPRLEEVPIGPGHFLYRVRATASPSP